MSDHDFSPMQRREFLQAGALTSAAALSLGSNGLAQEPKKEKTDILPTRKLGKTGVDVTLLNHGTWKAPGALDRLLRTSYAAGVRYYDTAKVYGTEPGVAKWLQAMPEVRKNIFLATKDWPKVASQMMGMLEKRLEVLKVDYVDLFFVHALGDSGSAENPIDFAGSKEFKDACEAIKKSGKAKFVGFSTHHATKAEIIQKAAEANFIDVIMVAYNPWIDKSAKFNKALDAAHKAGIGLISMKQLAGSDKERLELLGKVSKEVPSLKEKGLTPYGGMLHAIWSDERFSTSCVSMHNLDQIAENTDAARKFAPLKAAELEGLKRAFLASNPTMCANCDGSCSRAGGTEAELGNLTRFLTYHEHHGARSDARQEYAELSEAARDWKGADLAAAQAACHSNLNFSELLPKVERYLA